MLKNIIAPVQAWLLSQGKCVGCGKELSKGEGTGFVRVRCGCGRMYMYDTNVKRYRRATIEEAK